MKNDNGSSLHDSIFKQTDCLTGEQIRDYVNQSMTPAEKRHVQNHLLQCPICSDAVEGAEAYAGEYAKMVAESKRRLKFGTKSRKVVWMYRASWVAAAAIVMFFLLNVQEYFLPSSPYEALYQQYFEPYPNMVPLVRGNQSDNQLQYAMFAYEAEAYEKSLIHLKTILDAHPDSSIVQLYTGICLLSQNEIKEALDVLKPLRNDESDPYQVQALWYTALALMKHMRIAESESILLQLVKTKHEFTDRSQSLIRDINGITDIR